MNRKLLFFIPCLFFCLTVTLAFSSCGSETTQQDSSNTSQAVAKSSGESDDSSGQTQEGTRGSHLQILTPEASGSEVYTSDVAEIDASHTDEGYVMVNYTGSNEKVKLQIAGPKGSTYTFTLHGGYETFPLTEGDGSYQIAVYENISADQYANAMTEIVDVTITNEFGPYLYPNQYVNYTDAPNTAALSEKLATPADSDMDVVSNVYQYVTENITYDYDKAATVQSGYLPDVDETLATGKGICFDYSALMASLLRMQGIPTRMEHGYNGEIYHAWISVYIEGTGWINAVISFDGTGWHMMDPTFASTSDSPTDFIPDESDYVLKYIY